MDLPLAFLQGPWRLTMGLGALDPADWLWPDDRHAAEVAERARLIREQPDQVYALLPGAEPAAQELHDLVRAWLAERRPDLLSPPRPAEPPLLALGRLVQEDFCILQRDHEAGGSAYELTAAILCFPAHWHLREKIGRGLREIHEPVPGFADRLGGAVERMFTSLRVERPVWRANWSVVEDDELFHPHPRESLPHLSAENAGELLRLRVERQTLRRLPRTGAVVFGIRTLIEPLARTARRPGAAGAMAARLREMEDGMAVYKGVPAMRAALLGYLDRVAAQEAGPAQA